MRSSPVHKEGLGKSGESGGRDSNVVNKDYLYTMSDARLQDSSSGVVNWWSQMQYKVHDEVDYEQRCIPRATALTGLDLIPAHELSHPSILSTAIIERICSRPFEFSSSSRALHGHAAFY